MIVLLSFGVIFLAELGDKSQLLALTYAMRYRWWVVLGAIGIATALLQAISVGVGYFLGVPIPQEVIALVGGLAMLAFGFWTLLSDSDGSDEVRRAIRTTAPRAFLAIASSFFLAELGDKTMLVTITLATDHAWFWVWLGSTLGLVTADALAVALGVVAVRKLPRRAIEMVSAGVFFATAAWLLISGLTESSGLTTGLVVAAAVVISAAGVYLVRRNRTQRAVAAKEAVTAAPTEPIDAAR